MKNEPITIAGTTINPGEKKTIELPAASLYTQNAISIPVHVVHGKFNGPRIFLIATIHGDEVNGIEIIRRLLSHSALRHLRGTLFAVPIANIYGFISLSRYLPDRRDLNRSFPGSKSGSLAARLANLLVKEIISKCTHGIDLHTGKIHINNLPQIRADFDAKNTFELAKAFNAPVTLDAKLRDGSLRQAAIDLGIPLIVYEGGEALRLDEIPIKVGVKGILNVLHYLKMISVKKKKTSLKTNITHSSFWIRAPESGVVRPLRSLGSLVKKNDVVGAIGNPFSMNEQAVISPYNGIIIGANKLSCVNEGDPLFHIATFKKIEEVFLDMDHLQNISGDDD